LRFNLPQPGVSIIRAAPQLRAIRELSDTKSVTPASRSASGESVIAPGQDQQDQAERRHLTVMFCDLVGSTALSARLDPEDLQRIIRAYHRHCADVIAGSGGFVAQYLGDGVLAYFGYPQAHEDDAERAVRAALSLVETVPQLLNKPDAELHVRIGIATGLVVVGDLIGDGTALGETPNVAARLQALAEPGQIAISNSTRRLTGGLFEYRDLGKITLRGLTDPVQVWRVTATSTVHSRFEARQETELASMMGREEELALLWRRWQQVAAGEGRVVLLSGEPGIGKSRLTAELERRLQSEPQTRMSFFCSPLHGESPLYPTIVQLERAAGFGREDTPEAKLAKLRLLPGLDMVSEPDTDVQLLSELLSIPTGDRFPPLNWTPQRKKERTLEALLRQLVTLSRRQPVLIVYEDVHWIDPSSRELLDMIVERVASLPILLVITFRTEFQPAWTGQAHVTTLSLNRLGPRESAALVGVVARGSTVPDEILGGIVERADGIPLFVEELTKAVLETGIEVDAAKATVSATPPATLAVPATLHASLMARLDRLGQVAKEIAQIGAAIGRDFSYELVASVAQRSEDELTAGLSSLSGAGIVTFRGTAPHGIFVFKHALVQDVAYGTLLRTARRRLHARIALCLEDRFPEIAAAHPEVIARHCTEGGLEDKAVEYWNRAGDQAIKRASNREAVEHLRRALSLLERRPESSERVRQELGVLSLLGPALMNVHGWAASEVGCTFDRARETARKLESSIDVAPPLVGMTLFYIARGQFAQAEDISGELFKMARELDNNDILLQAHHAAWPTRWMRGKYADAEGHIDAGLALYDEVRHATHRYLYMNHDPAVCGLSIGALLQSEIGHTNRSLRMEADALKLARRLQHMPSLAMGLWMIGENQVARGDVAAVISTAQELLGIGNEHRLPQPLARALILLGWALALSGHVAEGVSKLEEGVATWSRLGIRSHLASAMCLLAEAYLQGERYQDAMHQADLALRTATEINDDRCVPRSYILRASVLLQFGRCNIEAAEANLQKAITFSGLQGAKAWELRASIKLAQLWCDQGRRAEARDLLAPVYNSFSEGFDTPPLKEASALIGQLV
jgi:class 3 adenylate cyclase/tetratricopeptide (TPR) repeat protein